MTGVMEDPTAGPARRPLPNGRYRLAVSNRRARANLLLLVTSAIWGFAFVGQRVGAEFVGPLTFNGVRFALGGAALLPLLWFLDRRAGGTAPGAWRDVLGPGTLAGTALFLAATMQQVGIAYTTAGKASFITGHYIVLVPILGIALRHRTTGWTWLAVGLAVTGLFMLSITEQFTIGLGDGLQVVGAFFWACHILVIDKFSGRHDALRLSVVQFLTCSALSLALAPAFEAHAYSGIPDALIPILYGGLISVGIAYTLQVVAQRDAKASTAALIMSLESVFGALGGAWLLGEQLSLRGYLGCGLMLAGILVSQAGQPKPTESLPLVPEPVVLLGPEESSKR